MVAESTDHPAPTARPDEESTTTSLPRGGGVLSYFWLKRPPLLLCARGGCLGSYVEEPTKQPQKARVNRPKLSDNSVTHPR